MIEEQIPTIVNYSPNLQHLFQNHIGFGKAQYRLALPLMFLIVCQGAQTLILGLILPIVRQQWQLTIFQEGLGLTLITLGFPLGSFLQGYSDNYGRSIFVYLVSSLSIVFGLISSFSWSFNAFIITRFCYEIGIGICLPLTSTYISEITPMKNRGSLMSKMGILLCFGFLVSCGLGYVLLINNQWRLSLLILCIPGIISLIFHYQIGRQSLHYIWARKRTSQVYELVNEMCQLNNQPQVPLQYIQNSIEYDIPEDSPQNISICQLFNEQYKAITGRLMILWVAYNFTAYGLILIFPTILKGLFKTSQVSSSFQYLYLAVMAVVEMVVVYIGPFFMDHPHIGRKKTIEWTLYIITLASTAIIAFDLKNIVSILIIVAVIKAADSIGLLVIYVYTAELYQTLLRSKAEGICALVGRFSIIFLGVLGLPATKWMNGEGLYLLFVIITGIAIYAIHTIPHEIHLLSHQIEQHKHHHHYLEEEKDKYESEQEQYKQYKEQKQGEKQEQEEKETS